MISLNVSEAEPSLFMQKRIKKIDDDFEYFTTRLNKNDTY